MGAEHVRTVGRGSAGTVMVLVIWWSRSVARGAGVASGGPGASGRGPTI